MSGSEEHIGFAILELMGHRRMAGYVSERQVAGTPFVQIDVPAQDGPDATQLYSPQAVYCITPTTEEIARAVAAKAQPAPVHRWELPAPPPASEDEIREADLVDDGDDDPAYS